MIQGSLTFAKHPAVRLWGRTATFLSGLTGISSHIVGNVGKPSRTSATPRACISGQCATGGKGLNSGVHGLAMVTTTNGGYDFSGQATRFSGSFSEDKRDGTAVPIALLAEKAQFDGWLESRTPAAKSWLKSLGQDSHRPGRVVLIPSLGGEGEGGGLSLSEVGFCLGEGEEGAGSPFALCSLRDQVPPGSYVLDWGDRKPSAAVLDAAALSWALGAYEFDRYKSKQDKGGAENKKEQDGSPEVEGQVGGAGEGGGKGGSEGKVLVWPRGEGKEAVESAAASTFLVRDLISTPCEDMGPHHLQEVFEALAGEFGGTATVIKGEELLKPGDSYPMIHAVGRAAAEGREPRLLELIWESSSSAAPPSPEGNFRLPKVTLVGKGVCFDTGGLDIKPAAGMLTMKKDMGGAAQVIGLARMVMSLNLPVRLRVLVPAVENSISGGAFRPGDVLTARNGKTSEIGNTDAEGRLVLADALVDASSENPDLIVDCATLTGAARVALGTDVPVVFCNDEHLAARLMELSGGVHDQVWRLPLWEGYRKQLSSKIADMKNIGSGGYGGAITAALYLEAFIGTREEEAKAGVELGGDAGGGAGGEGDKKQKLRWVHMDFMAYNQGSSPGRPEGGEAQGMRALYALLDDLFG